MRLVRNFAGGFILITFITSGAWSSPLFKKEDNEDSTEEEDVYDEEAISSPLNKPIALVEEEIFRSGEEEVVSATKVPWQKLEAKYTSSKIMPTESNKLIGSDTERPAVSLIIPPLEAAEKDRNQTDGIDEVLLELLHGYNVTGESTLENNIPMMKFTNKEAVVSSTPSTIGASDLQSLSSNFSASLEDAFGVNNIEAAIMDALMAGFMGQNTSQLPKSPESLPAPPSPTSNQQVHIVPTGYVPTIINIALPPQSTGVVPTTPRSSNSPLRIMAPIVADLFFSAMRDGKLPQNIFKNLREFGRVENYVNFVERLECVLFEYCPEPLFI